MAEHLFKNWVVYVLLGGFVWLAVFLYVHSRKEEKNRQEQEKSLEGKSWAGKK